jgi:cytochrome c551
MFQIFHKNDRLVAVLTGLLLVGGLVACGGTGTTTVSDGARPAVSVALATVPAGRTAPPASSSPTARVPEQLTTPAQTTVLPTAQAATAAPVVAIAAATAAVLAGGDSAAAGKELFTANGCVACHGVDLAGGIGPKLAGRTVQDLPEDRIRSQMSQGGNGMPMFPNLTSDQVSNIMAFIRSS